MLFYVYESDEEEDQDCRGAEDCEGGIQDGGGGDVEGHAGWLNGMAWRD